MPKYKITTEIEVDLEGGTEKARNAMAKTMIQSAIQEGFEAWNADYLGMIGTIDPNGHCSCHDGWIVGVEFDTPCDKCDGEGRKLKSLAYKNFQYNVKRVTRINAKSN